MTAVTRQARTAAVARYLNGETLREIAEDVGVDRATLTKWVRESGQKIRKGGRYKHLTAEDIDSIRILYERGRSVDYLSHLFGLSRPIMTRKMKDAGIAIRDTGWLTPARRKQIAADMRNGTSIADAAKEYGVAYKTAKRIADRME